MNHRPALKELFILIDFNQIKPESANHQSWTEEENIMNKLTFARPIYLAILLILVALLVAGPAMAQDVATAPGRNILTSPQHQDETDPVGPTDHAELEAFLDELMVEHMEELHKAGAAVSASKLHQGSQGWMISKP
jgi:hypothetical protein